MVDHSLRLTLPRTRDAAHERHHWDADRELLVLEREDAALHDLAHMLERAKSAADGFEVGLVLADVP